MRADEICRRKCENESKENYSRIIGNGNVTYSHIATSNVKAASGTASLDSLGKFGTVNVGSKSESGIWLQTLVNEKPVFVWIWDWHVIPDIPIFQRQRQLAVTVRIRKMLWKLKFGYWYAISKNKSNKAWVYAQLSYMGC